MGPGEGRDRVVLPEANADAGVRVAETSPPMKAEKRKSLEKAGWQVGSAADFLSLSKAEAAYVEMKLALAQELAEARRANRLTQQNPKRLCDT